MTDQVKLTSPRYIRKPDLDRHFDDGNGFAGDAWLDTVTNLIVYSAVGYDRNANTNAAGETEAGA
jgi:hypothetical protein